MKGGEKYQWVATIFFTYHGDIKIPHRVAKFKATEKKAVAKVKRMAKITDFMHPNPGGEFMPGMGIEWTLERQRRVKPCILMARPE